MKEMRTKKICQRISRKETTWKTGIDGRIILKWILKKTYFLYEKFSEYLTGGLL
jgi:hypothetical protein